MGIMSSIAQANIQKSQGKIDRMEAETQALAEEAAGVQRESDRKGRLAEALASQNASAGARGVAAFEGSPLSVMREDMRRETQATGRDEFQTRMKAKTLRARGKISEDMSRAASKVSLLTGAEQLATKVGTSFIGG